MAMGMSRLVVVAQTIKGGLGPVDGGLFTGSSLALPVILVVLALMTLIVWPSTLTTARRLLGTASRTRFGRRHGQDG